MPESRGFKVGRDRVTFFVSVPRVLDAEFEVTRRVMATLSADELARELKRHGISESDVRAAHAASNGPAVARRIGA